MKFSPSCADGSAKAWHIRGGGAGWNDHGVPGVITAREASWTAPFSGLSPRAFNELVAALRRGGLDPVRWGRPRSLALEDRVLLVAAYWRT
jgi:hypothetical protein